jgi:hypothetical protein
MQVAHAHAARLTETKGQGTTTLHEPASCWREDARPSPQPHLFAWKCWCQHYCWKLVLIVCMIVVMEALY